MKKKLAAQKRKAGQQKSGPRKYTAQSVIVPRPATSESARNLREALANAKQAAAAVLAPLGYVAPADAKPDAKYWAPAMEEPTQSAARQAARRLNAIHDCRRALAAGDAESAAWAAYTLADLIGRNNLAGFSESILRDIGRQSGSGKGGRTKRANAVPAWEAVSAAVVMALGPDCSAQDAWRWLASHRTTVPGGAVTVAGEGLVFIVESDQLDFGGGSDGDDATLSFDAWRTYLTAARKTLQDQ